MKAQNWMNSLQGITEAYLVPEEEHGDEIVNKDLVLTQEVKNKAIEIVKELIDTSWGGDNKEQGKAVQLLRGLAFSDEDVSNKFMAALDKFTSGLDIKDFE